MRCPSCYEPIADDDSRCPHCDASLSLFNPPTSKPAATTARGGRGDSDYAGFWRRGGAYLFDTLIMVIIGVILALVLGFAGVINQTTIAENEIGINVASVVLGWLYFAILESSETQATWGKRYFGMRVTDLDGQRLTFLRATARYFAKFVSTFALLIGFFMAAFTARKQGLHDMMAGTLVVDEEGAPPRMGCAIVFVVLFLVVPAGAMWWSVTSYDDYRVEADKVRLKQLIEKNVQDAAPPETESGTKTVTENGGGETSADAGLFAARGDALATAVDVAFARDGVLPGSMNEIQATAAAPLVATLGERGVITLFSTDGKAHLTMMPSVSESNAITWLCASEGLPAGELPSQCAQE